MKKGCLIFAGCAILFSAASAAYGSPVPYCSLPLYLSVHGGLSILDDIELASSSGSRSLKSDSGEALTGALGYRISPYFRLEAEIGYQKNETDRLYSVDKTRVANGDINNLTGLLNGYIDFPVVGPITPYISGGLGLAKVEANDDDANISDDDTAFAYQVGAGIGFAMNEALTLDLKYRYLVVDELEIYSTTFDDYSSHNVYGGLRFAF